jgi:hypothetical protein
VSEPEFLSQTAEKLNADQRRAWFKARASEADRQGARWHRFTFDLATGTCLYEGWKVRPDAEGDPRFQFIGGPAAAA